MDVFKSIFDRLFRYLGYLCMVLLSILIFDVLAGVFYRYVLSNSLSWSGEVARYLCIWLSFIGSAILCYQKGHVGLEFLTNLFPKKIQGVVVLINNVLILIFLLYAVYFGYELAVIQKFQRSSALLMPMFLPYASVPAGCFLMALATGYHIVTDIVLFMTPKCKGEV